MTRQVDRAYYYVEVGTPLVEVISRGAYASLIRYESFGVEYQVYVDNNDLMFVEDDENGM